MRKELLPKMMESQKENLKCILRLLVAIEAKSTVNKMDYSSLSKVFGPITFPILTFSSAYVLFQNILISFDELFGSKR